MKKIISKWTAIIFSLKERWNIRSNFQLALILVSFSLAGSSVLFVRPLVFSFFGIESTMSLWFKVPLYLLVIFPTYQILLLLIGSLLGQFYFFWAFEKKMFNRFFHRKKG